MNENKLDELVKTALEGLKLNLPCANGREYALAYGQDYELSDYVLCGNNRLYIVLKGIPPMMSGEITVRFDLVFSRKDGWVLESKGVEAEIPTGVRIGHKIYEVRRGSSEKTESGTRVGHCDKTNKRLFVADDLDPELEQETWIHEITHAIINELGIRRLSSSNEEDFVRMFSKLVAETIRRNPDCFLPKGAGK